MSSTATGLCPAPEDGVAGFEARRSAFADLAASLWHAAPATAADLGPRTWPWTRWLRGYRVARHVGQVEALAAEHRRRRPDSAAAPELDERLRDRMCRLGADLLTDLGFAPSETDLLMRPDMGRATEDFARRARDDDPDLSAEDLGQALRNFWVVNFFQLLVHGAVGCTPPALGYSLLYPYTDNLLDDPERPVHDKRRRNERLGRRLAGEPLDPADPDEQRVFHQLERIDGTFAREQVPDLHRALQAIHRAQVASLRQHGALVEGGLGTHQLLHASIDKGGASVLVDAYLVDGRPSPELARFAFVYGVVLQLADDLQDVEEDLAAGHQTLFTHASGADLDPLFWRLIHTCDAALALCPEPPPSLGMDLRSLARANLVRLLVQAVGARPRQFSAGLRRTAQRHSPITFRRARDLRARLTRSLRIEP